MPVAIKVRVPVKKREQNQTHDALAALVAAATLEGNTALAELARAHQEYITHQHIPGGSRKDDVFVSAYRQDRDSKRFTGETGLHIILSALGQAAAGKQVGFLAGLDKQMVFSRRRFGRGISSHQGFSVQVSLEVIQELWIRLHEQLFISCTDIGFNTIKQYGSRWAHGGFGLTRNDDGSYQVAVEAVLLDDQELAKLPCFCRGQ